MAGKIGFGLRDGTFDVRYFVTNGLGVHAGTAMSTLNPEGAATNRESEYLAGGFYSKELTDGVMFQTGLTVTRIIGKYTGVKYYEWAYNPYLGAEFVYKGRFGLDFKVIPLQYYTSREKGNNSTGWAGGYGSLGAHLYF